MKQENLNYFIAVGEVFPTSDLQHHVVTPTMLYIGRCLANVDYITDAQRLVALYLVSIVVQYQTLSKRYVPEVVVALSYISHSLRLDGLDAFTQPTSPTYIGILKAGSNPDSVWRITHIIFALIETLSTLWTDLDAKPEIIHLLLNTLEPFKNCTNSVIKVIKKHFIFSY